MQAQYHRQNGQLEYVGGSQMQDLALAEDRVDQLIVIGARQTEWLEVYRGLLLKSLLQMVRFSIHNLYMQMLPQKGSEFKNQNFVWSQCVLQCFNSYMKKYQCSKLNTYLFTIFVSKWGYCVYIEIPLRLSPAPTFRTLKIYKRSDVTFSYTLL